VSGRPSLVSILKSKFSQGLQTIPQMLYRVLGLYLLFRGGRLRGLGFFLMAEIKAEMRFTASAGDLEREFCSGSVFVKERVERFQKN
jgi:hypothetical protein